ncbi:hypothetical protein B0T25DRAFT_16896 [Lasiosphaeria hispida]|uniref:Uncharacterized protein n=1 Tax=Lasiosphaeria hispida TaxID=260671 RepID=A0AAJ0MJK4_9PEZI|nr:hypothetical protein B0T25DRAFT_16896 [Lasiosphaeria hispida]
MALSHQGRLRLTWTYPPVSKPMAADNMHLEWKMRGRRYHQSMDGVSSKFLLLSATAPRYPLSVVVVVAVVMRNSLNPSAFPTNRHPLPSFFFAPHGSTVGEEVPCTHPHLLKIGVELELGLVAVAAATPVIRILVFLRRFRHHRTFVAQSVRLVAWTRHRSTETIPTHDPLSQVRTLDAQGLACPPNFQDTKPILFFCLVAGLNVGLGVGGRISVAVVYPVAPAFPLG